MSITHRLLPASSILLLVALSCNDSTDPAPTFESEASVSITTTTVTESTGLVEFMISIDQENLTTESIPIALTITGTATDPADFTGSASSVDIPSGESSVTLALNLVDDEEIEADETIVVTLATNQAAGISVGDGTVTVTIGDNDDTGTVDDCPNDNSLSTSDIGCPNSAPGTSEYTESIEGDVRMISANSVPNHDYGDARNQFAPLSRSYTVDATPAKASAVTSVLSETNRPRFWYGIALNGVIYAPAPATPFIFEDTSTGEFNWDWVFEPTMNKGPDDSQVKLDCASAHIGPQGYHYHGNMFEYAETIQTGLSTGTAPAAPVHVGWAADGFPVLYLYGPDASGNLKKLTPSYQLKSGNRPGDGISAPCGPYNGKYTVDYEYTPGLGDLDECNGVDRAITLTTAAGEETFDYFYVITETFPQVGRCFVGTPDDSFR